MNSADDTVDELKADESNTKNMLKAYKDVVKSTQKMSNDATAAAQEIPDDQWLQANALIAQEYYQTASNEVGALETIKTIYSDAIDNAQSQRKTLKKMIKTYKSDYKSTA